MYLGNVFSGGWSVEGGSADAINNLENVYIQNPSDSVVITIDAVNIAGDGIPYNGDLRTRILLWYASIAPCSLILRFQQTPTHFLFAHQMMRCMTLLSGSILGYSDSVTLSSSGEPAGTTAGFSVNPVNPPGTSDLTISSTGGASTGSYQSTS